MSTEPIIPFQVYNGTLLEERYQPPNPNAELTMLCRYKKGLDTTFFIWTGSDLQNGPIDTLRLLTEGIHYNDPTMSTTRPRLITPNDPTTGFSARKLIALPLPTDIYSIHVYKMRSASPTGYTLTFRNKEFLQYTKSNFVKRVTVDSATPFTGHLFVFDDKFEQEIKIE